MKNLMTIILVLGCSYSFYATAGNIEFKQQSFQKMVDIDTVGSCVTQVWTNKWKSGYQASFTYSRYYLVKKWLEVDGQMIPGSLESIVEKAGARDYSSSSHSSEKSALNECAQDQALIKAGAVTHEEIHDAIERFLRES